MIDWDRMVNGPVMAAFGDSHRFIPRAGSAFPVPGTFHEAYTSVDVSDGIGISTTGPAVGVNLSDFISAPLQGDRIDIKPSALYQGGLHAVKEVRVNGVGAALLLLNFVGA